MKKLSFIDSCLYLVNSIFATLLLISCITPYIKPKTFELLSVFSVLTPIFLIVNTIFCVYWIVRLKKQFFISGLVLLVGYQHINSLYQIEIQTENTKDEISLLSYNVRLFNLYKWSSKKGIEDDLKKFIKDLNSDIVCLQEYHKNVKKIKEYRYQYIRHNGGKIGQAILSKHKIINSGNLSFNKTSNNAIFADIKIKEDTIRVYNVHLESLRIDKKKEVLGTIDPEK
ncbi:MAG: endonuclease/exonuclease/phosphatase family protein, partial [Flavicella sp.]